MCPGKQFAWNRQEGHILYISCAWLWHSSVLCLVFIKHLYMLINIWILLPFHLMCSSFVQAISVVAYILCLLRASLACYTAVDKISMGVGVRWLAAAQRGMCCAAHGICSAPSCFGHARLSLVVTALLSSDSPRPSLPTTFFMQTHKRRASSSRLSSPLPI